MKFLLLLTLLLTTQTFAKGWGLFRDRGNHSGETCEWNHGLSSKSGFRYNCQIAWAGTSSVKIVKEGINQDSSGNKVFAYSSNCYCEIMVAELAHSPEGLIKKLTGMSCRKARIRKASPNPRKAAKFHDFVVRTYRPDSEIIKHESHVWAKKKHCN